MACENHMRTEERLDRLEKTVDQLSQDTHSSSIWQGKADLRFEMLSEKFDKMDIKFTIMFDELNKKIQAISDKPTKRLDIAINTLITVLVSAAITFFITQLLK